jgi:hypothetical protein
MVFLLHVALSRSLFSVQFHEHRTHDGFDLTKLNFCHPVLPDAQFRGNQFKSGIDPGRPEFLCRTAISTSIQDNHTGRLIRPFP